MREKLADAARIFKMKGKRYGCHSERKSFAFSQTVRHDMIQCSYLDAILSKDLQHVM